MSKKRVAVGGTFDHLHLGHQALLQLAANSGDELAIGLTTDRFAQVKSFRASLEDFAHREQNLHQYCVAQNWQFQIIPLDDTYGVTLTDLSISGLAVTTETYAGGLAVNQKRLELGMVELPLFVAKMVLDSRGQEIHSERIRAGEIDRAGYRYLDAIKENQPISDAQRQQLANPMGELVSQPLNSPGIVCVVGDVSLANFTQNRWHYDLGVFDGLSQRKHIPDLQFTSSFRAHNPASGISTELVTKLGAILLLLPQHSPELLQVTGEEDLAAAALILMLPLASIVYYGQANLGLIAVTITEEKKAQIAGILNST